MSEKTKIEWADSTASPWTGCTPASAGCDHCYARTLAKRYELGMFRRCTVCGGREFRRWDRSIPPGGLSCCTTPGCVALPETETEVARPRVFPSLCDWLDPEVPVEWLADLLDVIRRTPHLDWLLLTKRPGMWRERINAWSNGVAPSNVWIGATCEDQAAADARVPELLRIPAAVRFVSVEPMLGPVDLYQWLGGNRGIDAPHQYNGGLDWVICGGESGPGARPMHPDWPRTLRDQCQAAGVPFLFKQWGEWAPGHNERLPMVAGPDGVIMTRFGANLKGRKLDGREWNEMPGSPIQEGGMK